MESIEVVTPRSLPEALWFFLTAGFGLFLFCIIGLAVYRLTLDPLAKFPGPKLNAISPLPAIRHLLRGRLAFENKKLHDIYGPVVRISPNELSFNSAQAWEDIYGHRVGHVNMHKDPIHVGAVEALEGVSTLTMADDDVHARQRRALAHSFSKKAIGDQEIIVQGYVTKFIKGMQGMSDRNESFNMVDWLNYTTFDIIGDLAFGEPFGCLDAGKEQKWVALISDCIKSGAMEQATRRFASAGTYFQKLLMDLIPKEMAQKRKDHLNLSREKVLRRLEKPDSDHHDFIWYILKQRERFDLQQDEIIVNSALFIVAGSETTANALSGVLGRFIYNPDKYAKLCHEIRSSFQKEEDMNFTKLSELPYLNACLEETLRIHPPIPIGLLRTVPKGGDTIDGRWVPGGTAVSVGSWSASHNPVNFRDPDSFIPERWIGDEYASDFKKGMQPFSLGPRGCIGRHLSYLEMRCILARLIWNFDVVSVDGAPNWNPEGEMGRARAFNTWEKPMLLMKVVPVKR